MRQLILALSLLMILSSCGSRKIKTTPGVALVALSPRLIIKEHGEINREFNSLSGRMKIELNTGDKVTSVPASFRMIKDQGIWISAFFGLAKALITPEEVSFYTSTNKSYFKGSFEQLSTLVGTELNYDLLQRFLLGFAAVELKAQRSLWEVTNNFYRYAMVDKKDRYKLHIDIEPGSYQLKNTIISEGSGEGSIKIEYLGYQKIDGVSIPEHLRLSAEAKQFNSSLDIEYKNLSLNRQLKFPYKIPEGYKELKLNND